MRRVQRPRLAAEEALGEIGGVPQVEVADLRALDADDAEEMPGRNVECARLARRHDRLADLRHALSRAVVERRVIGRQPIEGIDDRGFRSAPLSRVRRRRCPGRDQHGGRG